eukprot:1141591-Pelagomonas_calceolata.AAC.2
MCGTPVGARACVSVCVHARVRLGICCAGDKVAQIPGTLAAANLGSVDNAPGLSTSAWKDVIYSRHFDCNS